jgi:hypothetical protein
MMYASLAALLRRGGTWKPNAGTSAGDLEKLPAFDPLTARSARDKWDTVRVPEVISEINPEQITMRASEWPSIPPESVDAKQ